MTSGLAGLPVIPLSLEQRDYLSLDRDGYGAIAVCSQLAGPVSVPVLTSAARYVMGRHEPLRMHLHDSTDGVGQLFAPPELIEAEWELPDWAPGALERQLVAGPDAARPGAVHLYLFREDDRRGSALAFLDHLACDGWGAHLFSRELWTAYRAMIRGGIPDLPLLTSTYSDNVRAQQSAAQRSSHLSAYWEALAPDFAQAATGLHARGPAVPGAGRADIATTVRHEHVEEARQLAQSVGIPVNTIPLACVVLAAWSMANSDALGLSIAFAGRERPGTRDLIGVFHRRVALLVKGIPDDDLARFLTRLAGNVLTALRFSRAPYSASRFDKTIRAFRDSPSIDLLYNQVTADFGRARAQGPRQIDEHTTAEPIAAHFWPGRWQSYQEPRVRLIVGGGASPDLRVVFNQGCVAEGEARCLLQRTVAILGGMTAAAVERRVRDVVTAALHEPAHDVPESD
jgi:hypothetical protein